VAAHQNDLLRQLCDKAIWLSHGNLIQYGAIESVLAARAQELPIPQSTADVA
jgi:ABC-type polysaccharide/polyol phosphate transport system ATPase subunit